MGNLSKEIEEYLEFEGKILGALTDEGVIIHANAELADKSENALESELSRMKEEILGNFEEGDELLRCVEMQAKLRLLIQKRMKTVKKIPQEYIDKYNEVVTRIREIVIAQLESEP